MAVCDCGKTTYTRHNITHMRIWSNLSRIDSVNSVLAVVLFSPFFQMWRTSSSRMCHHTPLIRPEHRFRAMSASYVQLNQLHLRRAVDGIPSTSDVVCRLFGPQSQQSLVDSGAGTIFQQGGQAWYVTQPFQAGGVGGTVSPPPHAAGSGAEPRRQTHLGNNRLEIN